MATHLTQRQGRRIIEYGTGFLGQPESLGTLEAKLKTWTQAKSTLRALKLGLDGDLVKGSLLHLAEIAHGTRALDPMKLSETARDAAILCAVNTGLGALEPDTTEHRRKLFRAFHYGVRPRRWERPGHAKPSKRFPGSHGEPRAVRALSGLGACRRKVVYPAWTSG
jgi:hypothetical protein